ncbi:MAG: hypothetical protein AB7O24_09170 [Kofleriaceae bacterium]
MFVRALPIAIWVSILGFTMGCEKTDHETIDKWTKVEGGPEKLAKALANEGIDADLSAHAAVNMVKMGKDVEMRSALKSMSPPRRAQVIAKLAPRLWDVARVEKETDLPTGVQVTGKDALFALREMSEDPALKTQIDTYLIDWYAVASYEGRAKAGANVGATVIREVGPAAGKKLMAVTNSVIAAPGQDKQKNRIGDELLLGMAASGDPAAVKYIIDIAKMDRGDPSLSKRAFNALAIAYSDSSQQLIKPVDPQALVPNLDALAAVAKDESMPPSVGTDAIELIAATRQPHCIEPLVGMVRHPHPNPFFRYAVAQQALVCGETDAILKVVRALPDDAPYEKERLVGAVAKTIAKLSPRAKVLEAVRALTQDKGKIARWVAIETLADMKSTEDLPRISAMTGSSDRLTGYWGESQEGKEDPTLGQRAKELVAALSNPASAAAAPTGQPPK